MRRVLAASVLAMLAGAAAYSQGDAGKDKAKLEFEVASINPSPPMDGGRMMFFGSRGGPGTSDPGRITYSNMTIYSLVVISYGLKNYQVSGAPDWLNNNRFEIVAKVPAGATKDDVNVMMQNLLADRFKLTVHRETKDLPIYALVVGKNGSKLKASSVPDAAPPQLPPDKLPPPPPLRPSRDADGCPSLPESAARPGNMMAMTPNGACMLGYGATMEAVVRQLSNWFDRPVIDMTELKGKFDYKLHFDPASLPPRTNGGMVMMGPAVAARAMAAPPPGDAPSPAPDHEAAPSIFAAMQEQLGLKLDARKAPIDLLVIDHVEKTPTEN